MIKYEDKQYKMEQCSYNKYFEQMTFKSNECYIEGEIQYCRCQDGKNSRALMCSEEMDVYGWP